MIWTVQNIWIWIVLSWCVNWFCIIFSGITAPLACPVGTRSNSSGLRIQEDCKPCPGGFYCNTAGITTPSGPCRRGHVWFLWIWYYEIITTLILHTHGMNISCVIIIVWYKLKDKFCWCLKYRYYCLEGALTSTPVDGVTGGPCPQGFYCPEGTVQPVPCNPGTYAVVMHATHCDPCMPGWYCVSGSLHLCPPGLFVFCLYSHFFLNSPVVY